jgi:hypothetical protein
MKRLSSIKEKSKVASDQIVGIFFEVIAVIGEQ